MQLTNTTDYAIRIVCYLAIKKHRVTTAKLASELKIPESYIPKITKQLKKEKIISASEGISGGYALAKNPEKISLFDVISCMESTMAISRCLEKDTEKFIQTQNPERHMFLTIMDRINKGKR